MMDDFVNAKMAHALCERLTSLRVEQARIYARLGVDILRLGDYVCMQTGLLLGLDIYRKFIKERTRAIVAAAKEIKPDILVVMHCDGCVDEMVDEYIEIGIEIVNAVQPECTDLAGLARKYGRRISFWGGIGTQRKK
jgi:uroporphyrinogen decarboxylase